MISGFSRLSKQEKINYLDEWCQGIDVKAVFESISGGNPDGDNILDNLSENVVSRFQLPYSIAPNFFINYKEYIVPLVTEESSVVAAIAKSAAYWKQRGGIHTKIIGNDKYGQVHFKYRGNVELLERFIKKNEPELFKSVSGFNEKMLKRGGGIKEIELLNKSSDLEDYFQLNVKFDTCDAMGANYMNSCLEGMAAKLLELANNDQEIGSGSIEIIMSILSNYTPESTVEAKVYCPVEMLRDNKWIKEPANFANRFHDAVNIAGFDINRAVTHNKGIYNGVCAVALATGNDWRAIEANGHAFASRSGKYTSLSEVKVENGIFIFKVTLPLQIGTVGGVTGIHPLAKLSMDILHQPGAQQLMGIMAAVGLVSNFAAIKSLVTSGIQKGHMRLHLSNILLKLNASSDEKENTEQHFKDKTVSHSEIESYLNMKRKNKNKG